MLLGINRLLRGPLLAALDELGHGDALVLADGNFPARRLGGCHQLSGVSTPDALRAVLSVFPVDPHEPFVLMTCPDGLQPVQKEILACLPTTEGTALTSRSRYDFYDEAAAASLIVQTGELRPYGNVLIRKGGINS